MMVGIYVSSERTVAALCRPLTQPEFHEVPVESGNGGDLDQRIADALHRLCRDLHANTARVVLERDLYSCRLLSLPPTGPDVDLLEMISNCMEPYLQHSVEDCFFSWKTLGKDSERAIHAVTCVRRDLLKSISEGLARAGCDLENCTVDTGVIENSVPSGEDANSAVLYLGGFWSYVHRVSGAAVASFSFPCPPGHERSGEPGRESSCPCADSFASAFSAALVEADNAIVPGSIEVVGAEPVWLRESLAAVFRSVYDVPCPAVTAREAVPQQPYDRGRTLALLAADTHVRPEGFDGSYKVLRPLGRRSWAGRAIAASYLLSLLFLIAGTLTLVSACRETRLAAKYSAETAAAWTALHPREKMPVDVVGRLSSEARIYEGGIGSPDGGAGTVSALRLLAKTVAGLPENVPCQIDRLDIGQNGATFSCVTQAFADAGRIAQSISQQGGLRAEAREIKRLENGSPAGSVGFELKVQYER